jgi:hypothetical protein
VINEIVQYIEVWDYGGDPILHLCTQTYFTEEQLYMADVLKALTGDGKAKVRRELAETLGGPHYSSVRVTTSIEVTCDQSTHVVKRAAREVFAELQILNEDALEKAWAGLQKHVAERNADRNA